MGVHIYFCLLIHKISAVPLDRGRWLILYCKKKSRNCYSKYCQLAASAFTVNYYGDPKNFGKNYLVGWGKDV